MMKKKSSSQNDISMQRFQKKNHNFNNHAKVITIDKLTNMKKPYEILRQRLILDSHIRHHILKRVQSRIQKIKILKTSGLLFHVQMVARRN